MTQQKHFRAILEEPYMNILNYINLKYIFLHGSHLFKKWLSFCPLDKMCCVLQNALMNTVLSSWHLMQIHGKQDLNRVACHPYLLGSCTWHGNIMWNCRGVIAGLERQEGQGFCSKELTVTMKTHRVGILNVWTALISTCHHPCQ